MIGTTTPETVRDLIGLSFLHRDRARFRGASPLLDLTLADEGGAFDLGAVAELTRIEPLRSGVRVGAFASLDALSAALPELVPPGTSLATARRRLGFVGAKVSVLGTGALRTAPFDAPAIAPHEVPVAIEIPALPAGLGFGERSRATVDRDASFTLTVAVALRVANGWFGDVRISVELDGEMRRATLAEAKLEKQRVDPGFFAEAARLAAYAIEAVDARTSSATRAVTPLAMAALRDAFAQAQPQAQPRTSRGAFLAALALGAVAAVVPPCALAQAPDRLALVRKAKRLRVGLTGDYRPFSFVDASGNWSGLDVDVAHRLASALGVELSIVKTTWPTMRADLTAGAFDLAMGGVSRSPERAAAGLLTRAYVVDGKVALVRAAERLRFATLADFDRPAVRVAVNPGGTNASFVAANLTHATVTVVEQNLAIPPLVADGMYDVMFTDGVEAAYYAQRDPRLAVVNAAHPFTHIEKVYWVAADGPGLAAWVDQWMRDREADGTYKQLRVTYIGSDVNAP